MTVSIPDTVGYLFKEAQRILEEAGCRVQLNPRGLPLKGQLRVIRQRTVGEKTVELTLASEIYEDPSLIEKEVKKNALQDYR
ncbi:MAG TPA: hypothetical protein GXX19_04350 [Syntrophomonadaceae bacterium]|nr:hypothetical protein [Syntrophomonadaceae bacterium]